MGRRLDLLVAEQERQAEYSVTETAAPPGLARRVSRVESLRRLLLGGAGEGRRLFERRKGSGGRQCRVDKASGPEGGAGWREGELDMFDRSSSQFDISSESFDLDSVSQVGKMRIDLTVLTCVVFSAEFGRLCPGLF